MSALPPRADIRTFPTSTGAVEHHKNMVRSLEPVMKAANVVNKEGEPKYALAQGNSCSFQKSITCLKLAQCTMKRVYGGSDHASSSCYAVCRHSCLCSLRWGLRHCGQSRRRTSKTGLSKLGRGLSQMSGWFSQQPKSL
jgi:hypothetical protein